MTKRTQGELQVGDADVTLAPSYVSSGVEEQAELDSHADKAEAILNDRLANDKVLHRMSELEEMFTRSQTLLMSMLKRMGFSDPDAGDEEKIVKPTLRPDTPIDAIITIYIPEGYTPMEKEPIPVGVNGNLRWIPRGVYTQVTASELEVLQNAVYEGEEYPVANDTPLSQKNSRDHFRLSVPIPYRKPRFPLLVHDPPR